MLAYPPASVRWKKHPLFPIHRHRLIFGTVCALALLNGQVAFAIGSIREENQASILFNHHSSATRRQINLTLYLFFLRIKKCKDPNSGVVGLNGIQI